MLIVAAALAFPGAVATLDASAAAAGRCPDVAHYENAAHDGFNCSLVPPRARQKWSVTLNGAASYPVIAGGRVFVTTSNPGGRYGGSLYALSARTGQILWGPVSLPGSSFYFPLAYDNGRVFVDDFDGTVRAFDAATGIRKWSARTNRASGEPVAINGMVWVDGNGGVEGLSERTGAVTARSVTLDGDGATAAVNGSAVYLSAGCQTQYRLSLTAAIVWTGTNGCTGSGGASAALWNDQVYGSDGHVVMDQATGTREGSFSGLPAFHGTTGYFASGTTMSALDVADGDQLLWTVHLPAAAVAGPLLTPSAVWVGTSAGTLLTLNPDTGAVLSTITLPGVPGGGGQYSGDPSDIGIGNDILIVPTGSTVTAFG